MRVQTTFNDKLKKHSSHHTFIPDWMHDCVEWGDCDILIEKIEQKNKQRMKIRLANKIMKQARHLSTASDYWYRRLRDFEYKICYGFVGKKDHRITKVISLASKKK